MSSQSEVLDKEIDLFMIEAGIAVYQVGDVYDARETGELLSDEEKSRWFVTVLADSPLAATVLDIPLAQTEIEAWEYAAEHYGFKRNDPPRVGGL